MEYRGKRNGEHGISTPFITSLKIRFDLLQTYIGQSSVSNAAMIAVGFSSEVVEGLLNGLYTKVVSSAGARQVWDYTAKEILNTSSSDYYIYLRRGDGFDIEDGYSITKDGETNKWTVLYAEI